MAALIEERSERSISIKVIFTLGIVFLISEMRARPRLLFAAAEVNVFGIVSG